MLRQSLTWQFLRLGRLGRYCLQNGGGDEVKKSAAGDGFGGFAEFRSLRAGVWSRGGEQCKW
jgi:hypothetical protein